MLGFAFVPPAIGSIDPDLFFRLPVTYLQKLPLQDDLFDALLALQLSSATLAQSSGQAACIRTTSQTLRAAAALD